MQGVVARTPAMKMPLLCICYGHQLMAEAWGARSVCIRKVVRSGCMKSAFIKRP
ncbi:hypothetical protein [Pseudomonas sp. 008]|uniref:glutamine amidotransferase-related protein n=1 Tax=Pseudomonas sp. 008 TaxID=2803906 RepID=UPI0035B51EE1